MRIITMYDYQWSVQNPNAKCILSGEEVPTH